eukprot:CCRYP_006027-RA/>CCRYP_006027-RA protein AED:0.47 eAED:0.47 QI:0/0/0/1/0/0/2/0/120
MGLQATHVCRLTYRLRFTVSDTNRCENHNTHLTNQLPSTLGQPHKHRPKTTRPHSRPNKSNTYNKWWGCSCISAKRLTPLSPQHSAPSPHDKQKVQLLFSMHTINSSITAQCIQIHQSAI